VSIPRIRALWAEAPWTLRVYVGFGVLSGLWCAIAYRSPYNTIAAAIFLAVAYFLLSRARWMWIVALAGTSIYFLGWLLAWGLPAITNFIALVLLLAPPTRRYFARAARANGPRQPREGISVAKARRKLAQLSASPVTLKLVAVGLFAYEVGRLLLGPVSREFDAKPGGAALLILLGVAIFGLIGYFTLRGSRVMWLFAVGLLTAVVIVTAAQGHWPQALVPCALLGLLLAPGSVAFVWWGSAN
jgi:hypothetical protein